MQAKPSCKNKGEISSLQDKQKLREFTKTSIALQEMLKELYNKGKRMIAAMLKMHENTIKFIYWVCLQNKENNQVSSIEKTRIHINEWEEKEKWPVKFRNRMAEICHCLPNTVESKRTKRAMPPN